MNLSFRRPLLSALTGLLMGLMPPTAIYAANNGQSESYKRDYEALRATVHSLRDVYQKQKKTGDVRSKAVLAEVDTRYAEAEQLARGAEYDMAIVILEEGSRALAMAISDESRRRPHQDSHLQSGSMALDTHQLGEKDKPQSTKAHFEEHRDQARTLIEAARRIMTEKKTPHPLLGQIETLSQEADALADKGRYDAGRQRLELAEVLTKKLLHRLRHGEELRADKNFSTPADEYRYEQSRNDEYGHLTELLPSTQKKPDAPEHVAAARQMRQAAEAHAQQGNFAEALKVIEDSTIAYIRVVRDAGLPI